MPVSRRTPPAGKRRAPDTGQALTNRDERGQQARVAIPVVQ